MYCNLIAPLFIEETYQLKCENVVMAIIPERSAGMPITFPSQRGVCYALTSQRGTLCEKSKPLHCKYLCTCLRFILSKWMLGAAKNLKHNFGRCCVALATVTTLTTQIQAERHFTGGRRLPWQHSKLSVVGPDTILHIITKVRRPTSETSAGSNSPVGSLFWVHRMPLRAKRYFIYMAAVQPNEQEDLSSALGKQCQLKKHSGSVADIR